VVLRLTAVPKPLIERHHLRNDREGVSDLGLDLGGHEIGNAMLAALGPFGGCRFGLFSRALLSSPLARQRLASV
jgi:hypothetical protein